MLNRSPYLPTETLQGYVYSFYIIWKQIFFIQVKFYFRLTMLHSQVPNKNRKIKKMLVMWYILTWQPHDILVQRESKERTMGMRVYENSNHSAKRRSGTNWSWAYSRLEWNTWQTRLLWSLWCNGGSIKQTVQGNKIHDREKRGLQEDRGAFSRRVISRKK